MAKQKSSSGVGVKERIHLTIKEPTLYTIVFHNDDVTTFDFVVLILNHYFHLSAKKAFEFAVQVDTNGEASIGKYTYDIANTLVESITHDAQSNGFPLKLTLREI